MPETSTNILRVTREAVAPPAPDLASLAPGSPAAERELTEREAKLVSALQAAFSPPTGLTRISLYLNLSKAGLGASAFLFLDHGLPVPPAFQPVRAGTGSVLAVPAGAIEILLTGLDQTGERSLGVRLVANAVELFESREREELLMEEVAADWESLDALCEVSTDIFSSPTIQDCVQRLIQRLGVLKDGFNGALFLHENSEEGTIVTADGDSKSIAIAQLGPLKRVLTERKTTVLNAVPAGFFESGEQVRWRAARCLAAVPMLSRESVRGFVAVWSESADKQIDTSFQHLIDALGNRISLLLECDALTQSVRNTELLEQELEIAATIQNTLLFGELPQKVPGVTFAAVSIPSKTIGGDFYDFYQQGAGTIDLLIGDVMGKGVAAALLGTAVKNEFTRAVVSQAVGTAGRLPPAGIVQQVSAKMNKRLIEVERFVTLCYARLSLSERRLEYVDCGHTNTIVHSRKHRHSTVLQGHSLPLGIDVKDKPGQETVAFGAGDTFLFYSDGATENLSRSGEMFGMERLIECVSQWSSCGPDVLLDQLCRQALNHSGSAHFSDDFTAIAVRIGLDQSAARQVVKTQLPRNLGQLETVREWLEAAASLVGEGGLVEDDVTRLLLVSVEAFDNCVIHGVPEALALPVDLEAEIFGDSLRVTLRHAGPEFDPFHARPPSFDGSRDNGFGLYIMLQSADEFSYRHDPPGVNTIIFSILQTKRATDPPCRSPSQI